MVSFEIIAACAVGVGFFFFSSEAEDGYTSDYGVFYKFKIILGKKLLYIFIVFNDECVCRDGEDGGGCKYSYFCTLAAFFFAAQSARFRARSKIVERRK